MVDVGQYYVNPKLVAMIGPVRTSDGTQHRPNGATHCFEVFFSGSSKFVWFENDAVAARAREDLRHQIA